MSDTIIETFALTTPWPTVDPFLFCVHHHDDYPAGNATLAPSVPLEGRNLGSDFSGRDGWSMYHGLEVPGFPQHPHRGFETVTYVRRGLVDHSDSLGATARFGAGDTQWLTAGKGIVHCEMFPLVHDHEPNPLELFQIWLNLPSRDKMVQPYFTMLWASDIPTITDLHPDGSSTVVTVIAGSIDGVEAPAPPPDSWASRVEADVAIWHIAMSAGANWSLPASQSVETVRLIYAFDGTAVTIDGRPLPVGRGAVIRADRDVTLSTDEGSVDCLILQGRPIGEPVAQYGPFVMNTRAEIEQAFADYRRTEFGGWPWPTDDPNHGRSMSRFARQPNGDVTRPTR